ncbi:MAG: EAL domain-containing protein [Rubrivivax sp.]|jgi:EAL domain-containing protein (putative c-di-GMP-specific phosphodiesterase class I)/CheY-like chemotaxis protein
MTPPQALPDRVVLVDDDALVLKLQSQQLRNLGYQHLRGYEDARAALAALQTEGGGADLVLCDLQMPMMDGIEFLRALAVGGFQGRLLLVSGEQGRVLKAAAQLAQAHGLKLLGTLQKPVSMAQLQAVLCRAQTSAAPAGPAPGPALEADDLRRGLQAGELHNVYQPKVAMATGELVGLEALVRWQHPQRGLVPPDHFIGLAEDSGQIDELLWCVLDAALRDAAGWAARGLALSVAVNVSMDNLLQLDFPDRVAARAAHHGLPLSQLVLEVTESRLMRNAVLVTDTLTRLRLKRVGLSIDDFGTGHSSLVQLRDLPFEELKVDKSFVHGAAGDPALRSIVESNLRLGQQLGMQTVGEGVEDLDDWRLLRAAGCTLAQGYFISRPMPPQAVVAWAATWALRAPGLLVA